MTLCPNVSDWRQTSLLRWNLGVWTVVLAIVRRKGSSEDARHTMVRPNRASSTTVGIFWLGIPRPAPARGAGLGANRISGIVNSVGRITGDQTNPSAYDEHTEAQNVPTFATLETELAINKDKVTLVSVKRTENRRLLARVGIFLANSHQPLVNS